MAPCDRWPSFSRCDKKLSNNFVFCTTTCFVAALGMQCLWWCTSNYVPGALYPMPVGIQFNAILAHLSLVQCFVAEKAPTPEPCALFGKSCERYGRRPKTENLACSSAKL